MASMNVSLPDALKAWAEGLIQTGRYSDTSDYVRDLISKDKERAEKISTVQRLIDEAELSGASDSSTDDILAAARREASVMREL